VANLKEQEMLFQYVKTLAHIPHYYQKVATEIIRDITASELSFKSQQLFDSILQSFFSESNFQPATEDEVYKIFNLHEVPIPHQVECHQDWPLQYKECWKLKQASASRTIYDLVLQIVDKEFKKLEVNLNEGREQKLEFTKYKFSRRIYLQNEMFLND